MALFSLPAGGGLALLRAGGEAFGVRRTTLNGLILRNGTVLTEPGKPALHGASVHVAGECISAVTLDEPAGGPGARTIDCTGMTVTAGFWNCHVHFFERKWAGAATIPVGELERQLDDFTAHGFTTVFDLSSVWENTSAIARRVRSGEVRGPEILSTGSGLIPRNAMPPAGTMRMMGLMEQALPEISTPVEARAAVRHLLDQGVHAIKLFASGQAANAERLDPATLAAAVETASGQGRLVFAHPNTADDVRALGPATRRAARCNRRSTGNRAKANSEADRQRHGFQ